MRCNISSRIIGLKNINVIFQFKVTQCIYSFTGVLGPVSNLDFFLKDKILKLFWDAPFSLNLINDNKSFCVELYNNLTEGIDFKQCDIDCCTYSINSSQQNLTCGDYSVNIIAVNAVGNSTLYTVRIWNKGKFYLIKLVFEHLPGFLSENKLSYKCGKFFI